MLEVPLELDMQELEVLELDVLELEVLEPEVLKLEVLELASKDPSFLAWSTAGTSWQRTIKKQLHKIDLATIKVTTLKV